jgi:hypothetical protein
VPERTNRWLVGWAQFDPDRDISLQRSQALAKRAIQNDSRRWDDDAKAAMTDHNRQLSLLAIGDILGRLKDVRLTRSGRSKPLS